MTPPVLKTERYIIQPYRKEDEQRFVEMCIDKEVVRYMGGATGDPERERTVFHKIFKHYSEPETDPPMLFWGIYRGDSLCGHVQLKTTHHTNDDELEIVYMVHPDERKQGLMSEVLMFFKAEQNRWGRTIIATLELDNSTSMQLMNKWGIAKKQTLVDPDDGEEYLKLWLSKT